MRDVAEVRGLSWRRQRGAQKALLVERKQTGPRAGQVHGPPVPWVLLRNKHDFRHSTLKVSLPWKSCLCGPVTRKSLPCPRHIWRCVTIYNSPISLKIFFFGGVALKKNRFSCRSDELALEVLVAPSARNSQRWAAGPEFANVAAVQVVATATDTWAGVGAARGYLLF